MNRTIIVAGFEPFGRRRVNRSWEAVSRLAHRRGVIVVRLPVDFAALRTLVPALVARRPHALLLCGEAARRARLSVERIGLNVLHARFADNAGARPRLATVVADAPLAYPATWDAEAVLAALERARLPAALSHHAGTYACNAALYLALHAAAGLPARDRPRVGFLHVPTHGPGPAALARGLDEVILTLSARHAT